MKSHKWQLVNLELSKKLKELGVKQESLWWWIKTHDCYGDLDNFEVGRDYDKTAWIESKMGTEVYSAFTVAELGEMLPDIIGDDKHNIIYHCSLFKDRIEYKDYTDSHYLIQQADTEANARAKILIYLIEHKLMKNKIGKRK